MLKACYGSGLLEAGCDEAGRGCLAGPVFAAAVVLPADFSHPLLNDSKQLSEDCRYALRTDIEREAVAWAVAWCDHEEIDRINILKASFLAMHRALEKLPCEPEFLLIDGNRFTPYRNVSHACIVKGDGAYASIAAASVLAKTYRDDFMNRIAQEYPIYAWHSNKGYPTIRHREAVLTHGFSPYHRRTFRVTDPQIMLFDD